MKKDGSIEKIYGREDPIKSDFELLPNPKAYDSEKENYEHFFAKLKLYDWLKISKKHIIDVIYLEYDYIYLEYPIIDPYWEYISDIFIRDDEGNNKYIYPKIKPDYLENSNKKIIYYLDLGIVREGELINAIEIVNKNSVKYSKIDYLLKNINSDVPIIIIPSNVILQQYMMPNHLYGYIYYKNGWFLRKKTGDVEIDISSKKYRKLISFDDHGQRR
ncbi:MAG: hypothetical protein RXO36_06930 [Candidatus Nanopusillus acidilobi]